MIAKCVNKGAFCITQTKALLLWAQKTDIGTLPLGTLSVTKKSFNWIFHVSPTVAFHSPPAKIKKEPQSPSSDPTLSCNHKQPFQYRNGEQCLYAR